MSSQYNQATLGPCRGIRASNNQAENVTPRDIFIHDHSPGLPGKQPSAIPLKRSMEQRRINRGDNSRDGDND